MRKLILSAAACAAMVGVALAQVEASSSVYFLDVDPARYAGPAAQRLVLRVGDRPRQVSLGNHDEICVQLRRVVGDTEVIAARVRSLGPEPKDADVRVVAPDIAPGTYRSTPWGLLVRALPGRDEEAKTVKTAVASETPVCDLGTEVVAAPGALSPVAVAVPR
jgi:hypothetical protein